MRDQRLGAGPVNKSTKKGGLRQGRNVVDYIAKSEGSADKSYKFERSMTDTLRSTSTDAITAKPAVSDTARQIAKVGLVGLMDSTASSSVATSANGRRTKRGGRKSKEAVAAPTQVPDPQIPFLGNKPKISVASTAQARAYGMLEYTPSDGELDAYLAQRRMTRAEYFKHRSPTLPEQIDLRYAKEEAQRQKIAEVRLALVMGKGNPKKRVCSEESEGKEQQQYHELPTRENGQLISRVDFAAMQAKAEAKAGEMTSDEKLEKQAAFDEELAAAEAALNPEDSDSEDDFELEDQDVEVQAALLHDALEQERARMQAEEVAENVREVMDNLALLDMHTEFTADRGGSAAAKLRAAAYIEEFIKVNETPGIKEEWDAVRAMDRHDREYEMHLWNDVKRDAFRKYVSEEDEIQATTSGLSTSQTVEQLNRLITLSEQPLGSDLEPTCADTDFENKTVNGFGTTRLHDASAAGDLVLVTQLIENGADVDVVDAKGSTALHQAASYGRFDVVDCLLNVGANPSHAITEGVRKGTQAIHVASTCGAILRGCCDCADKTLVLPKTYHSQWGLCEACEKTVGKYLQIIRRVGDAVLEAGETITKCPEEEHSDDGLIRIVFPKKLFIMHGLWKCEHSSRDDSSTESFEVVDVPTTSEQKTPSNPMIIQMQSLPQENKSGMRVGKVVGNPVDLAPKLQKIMKPMDSEFGGLKKGFLNPRTSRAVPSAGHIDFGGKREPSVFMRADPECALCKHASQCVFNSIDPDALDGDKRSKLHNAAKSGQIDLVLRLINHDASLNLEEGARMSTPLHFAAQGGLKKSAEIVDLLIKCGADVAAQTQSGWLPLHNALKNGDKQSVLLLRRAMERKGFKDLIKPNTTKFGHEHDELLLAPLTELETALMPEYRARAIPGPGTLNSKIQHFRIEKLEVTDDSTARGASADAASQHTQPEAPEIAPLLNRLYTWFASPERDTTTLSLSMSDEASKE